MRRPEPTQAMRPGIPSEGAHRTGGRLSRRGPRRLFIAGGPGSGKSTLARRLGTALGIPVHELDAIAYEGPEFEQRPLAARLEDARRIADAPEWIVEGIHLGWTDALLERADLVVWLDHTSWAQSALRILRRFTTSAVAEAGVQPGIKKVSRFSDYRRHARQLVMVLLNTRDFYKPAAAARRYPVTRQELSDRLSRLRTRVVRCRTVEEVDALVAELTPEPAGVRDR